jgi:hypothetical protein
LLDAETSGLDPDVPAVEGPTVVAVAEVVEVVDVDDCTVIETESV